MIAGHLPSYCKNDPNLYIFFTHYTRILSSYKLQLMVFTFFTFSFLSFFYYCTYKAREATCENKYFLIQSHKIVISQPRLLNLILLNLIVRWPMGAAIVRPPNTKYTQSIGVCLEKLPKIVWITLLQFNYVFGYGNFFTVWSSLCFQNIYRRKKNSYRQKLP